MKKYLAFGLTISLLVFFTPLISAAQRPSVKINPQETKIRPVQKAVDYFSAITENRLIISTTSETEIAQFEQTGCQLLHRLKDGTALKCPPAVKIQNARPDRLFYLHDLEADVQIKADEVWNQGYDGTGVKVALLDTGVDDQHIELSDSLVTTQNFASGPSFDQDGHGTHVSGIITANGVYLIDDSNDNLPPNRATGVAPGAEIIVGKVCGRFYCYESDVMAGIEWAVAEGAKVISLSLGRDNFTQDCDSDPLAAKVNWAVSQEVLVVVSAGNEGAGVSSPACASQAIAVGAVDKSNVRPSWSNYGNPLDLTAPGVDILSTYSCRAAGDCQSYWYAWMSGTSASAPHVAGVAALLFQKNPNYPIEAIKQALYNSAFDLGQTGWDQFHGWGRVDTLACLNYLKECDSRNITIIKDFNIIDSPLEGKIVVFYQASQAIRDQVLVELSTTGTGGSSSKSCQITQSSCSVVPGENQFCLIATDCDYPAAQPDTNYQLKLTDKNCLGTYQTAEISP